MAVKKPVSVMFLLMAFQHHLDYYRVYIYEMSCKNDNLFFGT